MACAIYESEKVPSLGTFLLYKQSRLRQSSHLVSFQDGAIFCLSRTTGLGRFLPVTTDRFGSVRALEGLCADLTALIFELLR